MMPPTTVDFARGRNDVPDDRRLGGGTSYSDAVLGVRIPQGRADMPVGVTGMISVTVTVQGIGWGAKALLGAADVRDRNRCWRTSVCVPLDRGRER